jgi:hypothetical protein
MRFSVKDSLSEKELDAGLRSVIKDGLTSDTTPATSTRPATGETENPDS